jgi:hypothetical protein
MREMKYRSLLQIPVMLATVMVPATLPASAQAPKEAAPQKAEDPPPVFGVPKAYKYEVRGRRDPFVNPIPKPVPPDDKPAAKEGPRPPGLKGALLADTVLVGILTSSQEPSMMRVILQIPGNKAPYFALRGEVLYDAVIKEIRPDSVVFTVVTPANKQPLNPNREVVRRVRPSSGENK